MHRVRVAPPHGARSRAQVGGTAALTRRRATAAGVAHAPLHPRTPASPHPRTPAPLHRCTPVRLYSRRVAPSCSCAAEVRMTWGCSVAGGPCSGRASRGTRTRAARPYGRSTARPKLEPWPRHHPHPHPRPRTDPNRFPGVHLRSRSNPGPSISPASVHASRAARRPGRRCRRAAPARLSSRPAPLQPHRAPRGRARPPSRCWASLPTPREVDRCDPNPTKAPPQLPLHTQVPTSTLPPPSTHGYPHLHPLIPPPPPPSRRRHVGPDAAA